MPLVPFLLAMLMLTPVSAGAEEAADHLIGYEQGRLTVRVTDMPLDRLIDEIASATRATIRGGRPTRTVTFDFTARPVREALATVLSGESFVLKYGADGEIRRIELLGRGEALPTPTPVSTAPSPAAQGDVGAPPALQRKVEAINPLARAVGTTTPPIGRVLEVVTDQRPGVRNSAREVALAAFASDPEIEEAYLATLIAVDDAVLARKLRNTAAVGAAEAWLGALASRAPSPELRAKATAMLAALNKLPLGPAPQ